MGNEKNHYKNCYGSFLEINRSKGERNLYSCNESSYRFLSDLKSTTLALWFQCDSSLI